MQKQFTESGSSVYGASTGRDTSPPNIKPKGKVTLWPVYLDGQGYDDNGAYWGTGTALWCAEDESGDYRQFTRAETMAEACANLRFSPTQLARDHDKDLAIFLASYLDAVLFTGVDEEEEPLDARFTPDDIDADSLAEAEKDCRDFLAKRLNGEPLSDFLAPDEIAQAGHDFWLTRGGHGSGFWDWPEEMYQGQGDALADLARGFPERTVFAEGEKVFIEQPLRTPSQVPNAFCFRTSFLPATCPVTKPGQVSERQKTTKTKRYDYVCYGESRYWRA